MQLFAALGLWAILLFPVKSIDPRLQPYADWYERRESQVCNQNQLNHPNQAWVVFDDLEYPMIGYCSSYGFGYIISIDRKFWEQASEEDRLSLYVHETSHCVLKKQHSNDPYNYMYPSLATNSESILELQLLKDLREHCQNPN